MIADLGAAMLMQMPFDATGGALLGDTRPRPRLVLVATSQTQTPLPDSLESCPIDSPTEVTHVSPSIVDRVTNAYEHVQALSAELKIDPTAQALVDRLVAENTPPRGEKRLLPPPLALMTVIATGRWPPIWTLDELRKGIRDIVDAGPDFEAKFYLHGAHDDPLVCQGDVLALHAPLPMLDEHGAAIAFDDDYDHWLVVSNSCDHERSEIIQVAPLLVVVNPPTPEELERLRRYEYAKRFYVPPWPGDEARVHRLADFQRMAVLDKRALGTKAASVVARLDLPGWAVLHANLVMYLARDDGRFD